MCVGLWPSGIRASPSTAGGQAAVAVGTTSYGNGRSAPRGTAVDPRVLGANPSMPVRVDHCECGRVYPLVLGVDDRNVCAC